MDFVLRCWARPVKRSSTASRPSAHAPAREPTEGTKPAKSWSRTAINWVLDVVLFLGFAALAWVSVVLRYVFPPGVSAAGWTLWGLGFDDWMGVQFGLLGAFALLILVHVMLHWSWFCGVVASRLSRWTGRTIRPDDGTQTLYGVGLLIVALAVLGVAVAAAALAIQAPR